MQQRAVPRPVVRAASSQRAAGAGSDGTSLGLYKRRGSWFGVRVTPGELGFHRMIGPVQRLPHGHRLLAARFDRRSHAVGLRGGRAGDLAPAPPQVRARVTPFCRSDRECDCGPQGCPGREQEDRRPPPCSGSVFQGIVRHRYRHMDRVWISKSLFTVFHRLGSHTTLLDELKIAGARQPDRGPVTSIEALLVPARMRCGASVSCGVSCSGYGMAGRHLERTATRVYRNCRELSQQSLRRAS